MHREPLLNLLEEYRLIYPGEDTMRSRISQFVRLHEDCFQRTQLLGHVTGSAWILDEKRERTLLTHHRKLDRWLQPGGHADGDSDIAAVALREAVEETGLAGLQIDRTRIFDVDVHLIPQRGDEPSHYHYDCRFLIVCSGDGQYEVSDESHDLSWVKLTEIMDYTSEPSILRMVQKSRHSP